MSVRTNLLSMYDGISVSVVTRRLFVASRRAAAAPRAATRRRVRRVSPRDNQFESDV